MAGASGERDEPSTHDDAIPAALARAQPGGLDERLVHGRLMASLFERPVPAPRFGRFELRERIGQGGMGVVYRAWDPELERAVAIKIVDTTGLDVSLRERALREARSLAKLAHPNVITVYEAGLSDDRVWIAMEHVPGATMREWLTRTPRPDDATILRQWIAVGRGLVAVHAAGLVHRDVKPSNVLMGDDGRPRLIDFGLVRGPRADEVLPSSASEEPESDRGTSGSSRAAETQGFLGTHAYAAPEQREGGPVGAAADQYAFCVSLWESLHGGRPPVTREGVKLPARVQRSLVRGLAADPADRFPSLEALLRELEAAVGGATRWLGPVGGVALGAVAAGFGVARWHEPAEPPSPCAIEASALAGTWDEARRDALRERVLTSAPAFASTSFAALEAGLDEWSTGWLEARRTACAATRIEGVQSEAALDLRSACLERKRRAVQVGLDALLEPDAAGELRLAAQAPAILASLPTLDECADPERLAWIEPWPEPGPRRDAVAHGYDVLAQARALAAAGAPDQARARTDALLATHADALTYVPLQLELEAFPAQLELLRERTGRGVPRLVEIAREAGARRLDELAATLLVEAAEVAAGHWSKPELEQWLLDEAEAALRRLDRPLDARAVALRVAEAKLLAQAGRLSDALAAHEHARTLAQRLGDDARAETQSLSIAAMLAELGRFDEARTALEAGRDAAERRWGAGAPMVARHEFDLGVLALDTGRFEAASVHLDRVEALAVAAFGARSLYVGRARFARSKLRMLEGDLSGAAALVDDALAILGAELGPNHELLADPYEGQGVLRFFLGDLRGSIASYEAALRIRASVLAPEHPALGRLHSNIGESRAALGELDEARASFDRALAIHAVTLPADHPDVALPLKGRGQAALASGRAAQAIDDLERALRLQLATGSEPLEIADLRFSLARALAARDGRRSPEATALAEQARVELERRGMSDRVAAIDAWLRAR